MYYYIMDHSKSNSNEIKKIEKIYKGGSLVNIPDFRKKSKSYKESDYPSISRIYRYFMNFDWESPSMDKFREKLRNIINKSLVLNFTSNSYFFYICSNYFPKENNYINLDEANEAISKILEEILSSKTIIKRRSYHIQKLKLLEDLNQIIEMQAIDSSIHGKSFFIFYLIIFLQLIKFNCRIAL